MRLAVADVSKRYPGVTALDHVSIGVGDEEVLAVIGENGAGKSTLMKVLAGIEQPDQGTVLWDGEAVRFREPAAAIDQGIALIHQELSVHENLSVAENLFLGREPSRFGWLDRRQMNRLAKEAIAKVGLSVAPQTPVSHLSTAARQLVEIAAALTRNASVVIMDEPTSSLSRRETERLLKVVDDLKSSGVSVIYISHRLDEVERLADRVEVLRDGQHVCTLTGSQIHHDAMVSAMVGRDLSQLYQRKSAPPDKADAEASPRLRVRQLTVVPGGGRIDLEVKAGEIVGVAGLVGAGRSELLETIFGIRPPRNRHGSVEVNGRGCRLGQARSSMQEGMALVPDDRKRNGLLIDSPVRANTTVAALVDRIGYPWISNAWERERTADMIQRLSIKTASQSTRIGDLSGGNQQKIALAKWLIRDPTVLLLDEPTRGVDVGAKQEIYQQLDALAKQGLAILFVSSEMEEVIALADRVLVMHNGEISGELSGDAISEKAIMSLAVGGKA